MITPCPQPYGGVDSVGRRGAVGGENGEEQPRMKLIWKPNINNPTKQEEPVRQAPLNLLCLPAHPCMHPQSPCQRWRGRRRQGCVSMPQHIPCMHPQSPYPGRRGRRRQGCVFMSSTSPACTRSHPVKGGAGGGGRGVVTLAGAAVGGVGRGCI